MTVYMPVATAPDASYTIPDDGDDADAASVNVVFEPLADGLKYITGKTRKAYAGSLDSLYGIGIAVLGSSTSDLLTQTDIIKLTSVACAVGEVVNFRYKGHCLATSFSLFSLALGPSRLPLASGTFAYVNGEVGYSMLGSTTIVAGHLNAGVLDIYLQGSRSTSGTLYAYAPHWLEVEIIKP